MNRLKQILRGVTAAAVMSLIMCSQAFAARIAFSDPSAEAGNEVSVNMKITAADNETINSSNVMLSYDPQALQFLEGTGATGDAGSIRVVGEAQSGNSTELAFTLKFRALKPGTTTISVSTQEVYNADGGIITVSQEGSSSITITGEAVVSGGALLAGLQISPGTLSPAFSPDIDSYTAAVGSDVDMVSVEASAADEGATVSVSGNEGLQPGSNEIVCTVTAADGQTRTYRIVVTKGEGEGEGTSHVAQVSLRTYDRTITVLSAEEGIEVPDGFIQCSVNIDNQAVRGWIWNDKENPGAQPEYCIFYAMNEDGERDFYRYDLTEKTIQRYFRDPAGSSGDLEDKYNATAEEYTSLLHDYEIRFWIIIGLIALAVVLLIVIIVLVAGRGQKDDFIERRDDEEEQWEAEKRAKRPRISREEQYLRGLEEEEEEAEKEEDLAFIRKVQSEGARRGTVTGQGKRNDFRGGQSSGQTQFQTGGTGVRRGQTGPAGPRPRMNQGGPGENTARVIPAGQTRPMEVRNGAGQGQRPGKTAQTDDDFEVIDLE